MSYPKTSYCEFHNQNEKNMFIFFKSQIFLQICERNYCFDILSSKDPLAVDLQKAPAPDFPLVRDFSPPNAPLKIPGMQIVLC